MPDNSRFIRVSDETWAALKMRAVVERSTMGALAEEAVRRYLGETVKSEKDRSSARRVQADPLSVKVELEKTPERYPWDETRPMQVPPKRPGRLAAKDRPPAGYEPYPVGPEGVRPKGLSEKDWAIRKLKAQRAVEREG